MFMCFSHRFIDDIVGNGKRTAELLERSHFIGVLLDLFLDLRARAEAAEAGATARPKALDSKLKVA